VVVLDRLRVAQRRNRFSDYDRQHAKEGQACQRSDDAALDYDCEDDERGAADDQRDDNFAARMDGLYPDCRRGRCCLRCGERFRRSTAGSSALNGPVDQLRIVGMTDGLPAASWRVNIGPQWSRAIRRACSRHSVAAARIRPDQDETDRSHSAPPGAVGRGDDHRRRRKR
jgi:hypothetical protein